ncbi:hypothetical protein AVEN_55831-1 [Araneus ventricosus]|uniref:Uncharacterized protein n=1 Tax=Araneus ventricosus TaxID=182803 RepID=A0A4Y2CPQ3_ARAVE|nr:hypothetical protein AVEN_55831-1 [Araneus ventricosus]
MLMKKCILTENSTKLDFVIRTASSLVGQKFVLYDLVMAFFETNRRSEARKIMENLKDKSYSNYLEDICSQMYNQNKIFDLLELVNLLFAVDHIDREKIVHYLLKLSMMKAGQAGFKQKMEAGQEEMRITQAGLEQKMEAGQEEI